MDKGRERGEGGIGGKLVPGGLFSRLQTPLGFTTTAEDAQAWGASTPYLPRGRRRRERLVVAINPTASLGEVRDVGSAVVNDDARRSATT